MPFAAEEDMVVDSDGGCIDGAVDVTWLDA